MAVTYQIRPARPADAAELARLEPRCFTDPWSAQGFRETLESPYVVGLVAELKSRSIAGYLIARALEDEGEILNLAVAPESRRHGIGLGLLEAGLAALAERGVTSVFLEVRATNQAALDLYIREGFRPVGRRREYYRRPVEDAMILRWERGTGEALTRGSE